MSREIEFRAWLKDENKMYSVVELDVVYKYINCCKLRTKDRPYFYADLEDIELMQYTGLKDKNGVKIFEGDIVKCEKNIFIYSLKIGVAEFNDEDLGSCGCCFHEHFATGFVVKTVNTKKDVDKFFSLYDLKKCEVIGNIYENPELLEVS